MHMFPKINPTSTEAWKKLTAHAEQMKEVHMKDLFAQDGDRFKKFSFILEDLFIDFSKNRITKETMQLLLQLATECKVKEAIEAQFNGELINETEHRSVL